MTFEISNSIETDETFMRKALEFAQKAADAGDSDAQCSLAIQYENGIGTERDEEKALEYFRKSAASGNALARKSLERIENSLR